jgi:hypothetical protein
MIVATLACLSVVLGNQSDPKAVTRDFLSVYLKQGTDVGHLGGVRRVASFLTKRLLRVLDDAAACQRDWGHKQPRGSTDKPPFVDCCLFASSPEGVPTSFALGPTQRLPDGRHQIIVEYTYADPPGTYSDPTIPLQTAHWRDAVILTAAGGTYLIDDFVFLRDSSKGTLLSNSFERCRGRHWNEPP